MSEIEIRVVANGFIVSPAFHPNRATTVYEAKTETYVFETFESLSAWLKENLK